MPAKAGSYKLRLGNAGCLGGTVPPLSHPQLVLGQDWALKPSGPGLLPSQASTFSSITPPPVPLSQPILSRL